MRIRPRPIGSILLTALVVSAGALPANANELFDRNAPVAKMTEEDFRIAGAVIREALDKGDNGRSFEWKNPATGASGTVTPGAAFERQGSKCRSAEFTTKAGGESNRSAWSLCTVDGRWKAAEGR